MKKQVLITLISLFFSISGFATPVGTLPANDKIIMGYWTNWGTYKGYPIDNPDVSEQMKNLNVLAYAFFEVDVNGTIYFSDAWSDLNDSDIPFCNSHPAICHNVSPAYALGNFTKLTKQNLYPNVRIIISIGGAGHDDSFHNAFANPTNFINSLAAIVAEYHIAGVDLDFEPSAWSGLNDPAKYVQLTQAIRAKFPDHTKFMLTSAVSANPDVIKQFGADHWQQFTKNVDYIGIMAYDLHGGFDGVGNQTAFHSNLYSDNSDPYYSHFSADAAVQAYLQMGVPAKQIVLGIPAYGRVFSNVEAGATHGLYQNFNGLYNKGDLDGDMESYKSIVGNWLGKGFTDYFYTNTTGTVPEKLSGVYAYNPSLKQFVSYDNTALVDEKANYVNLHNLGGMMMWELRADISPADKNNASLLKHMYTVLKK